MDVMCMRQSTQSQWWSISLYTSDGRTWIEVPAFQAMISASLRYFRSASSPSTVSNIEAFAIWESAANFSVDFRLDDRARCFADKLRPEPGGKAHQARFHR